MSDERQIAEALTRATKGVEANPKDAEAWAKLGKAKRDWKDIGGAIAAYEQAAIIEPGEAVHHVELAALFETAGNLERAILEMERAAALSPEDAGYRASTAALLLKTERIVEATDLLDQGLRDHPDVRLLHSLYALCCLRRAAAEESTLAEDGQHYLTTRKQVAAALSWVEKAEKARFDDADLADFVPGDRLSEAIREAKRDIGKLRERRFHGSWLVTLAAVALGVFGGTRGNEGDLASGSFFVACGILYFLSCLTPRYLINRRLLAGRGRTAAQAALAGAFSDEKTGNYVVRRDLFGNTVVEAEKKNPLWGLVMLLGLLFALPVIVPFNFIRNWLNPAISD